VKRPFLNELMTSTGCEISYKVRLMIFVLARDHSRYRSLSGSFEEENMWFMIRDGWDFKLGEVNGTDY